MENKSFQRVMLTTSLVFGSILLMLIFLTNPSQGLFVKIAFYVSQFLFIFSFLSVILYFLKQKISNNELHFMILKNSTRQAALVACFVLFVLLLASIDLLTWWDGVLLAFSLILVELYFKSDKAVN